MDRKDLIADLKQISVGIEKRREIDNQKIAEYNYESYMDYPLERPKEPKQPIEPSNKNDRDINVYEYGSKAYKEDVNFQFFKWASTILIFGGIGAGIAAIAGFVTLNINKDQGIATIIIAAASMALLAIMMVVISVLLHVSKKKKAEREYKALVEERESVARHKKEKALKDYAEYEKNLEQYEEDLKNYKLYEADYETEKNKALEKIRKINAELEEKAQKAFAKAVKGVKTEYPEKYYDDINDVINIIEEMRADNVKEALAVLLDEKHKEQMLYEQQRLANAQEEYNYELEYQERNRQEEARRAEAQRDEDLRRQQREAAKQCADCACTPFDCPMYRKVTGVCPNFRTK